MLAELAGSGSTALQLHAMTALCAFLQRQHAAGCTRQTVWALHGAVAALPGALHSVHGLMSSGSGGRLEETDMQVGRWWGSVCVCVGGGGGQHG